MRYFLMFSKQIKVATWDSKRIIIAKTTDK